ncbi:MAG TPA: glycosyltransferase [Dermatophilaceae bacterium]|nr:glycosyltransferase [Dermatophilaceae bacterium]
MAASLRAHAVLYGNAPEHTARSIHALNRAVELAREAGSFDSVVLRLGDCSPSPVLDEQALGLLREHNPAISRIDYVFFGENLGSAAGQNRLLEDLDSDYLLIINPDTFIAPDGLVELLEPFRHQQRVGVVEARQLPFEHPKTYDAATGETAWVSTACALTTRAVIEQVGGFDSDTFFLYCDDVDWSWRVRLAGYRLILRDSARVFHDKRLTTAGTWTVGAAEEFYSAEAALLMAHKWGRPDLVQRYLSDLTGNGTERQRQAVTAYREREAADRLPQPVPGAERVATFVKGAYTKHRF